LSTATAFLPDKRTPMKIAVLAAAITVLIPGGIVRAWDIGENARLFGYAQLWFTVHEQMEEAGDLYQHPSGDEAATSTTGFSINRARLGADAFFLDKFLELNTQLRLERNIGILDLYLGIHPARWLSVYLGQFKIPAPRETLTAASDLDFIFRSTISENLVDYSLSRTTYASSMFYGVYSYLRDFGVGLKGELDIKLGLLRYFFMLGNGLGANLFIGGAAKKEYILTNAGQFFYGLRLEIAGILEMITVGGHINYNWHDNMVFNSGRVVFDLKRISYSGDATISLPGTGLRAGCLYGRGEIRDDYDDDGRTDLAYSGWECHLLWRLNDPFSRWAPASFWKDHIFEIGARFDDYRSEWDETGVQVIQDQWTFGANYVFSKMLKIQINYVMKRGDDPSMPDLDDDILLLSVQGAI